MSDCRKPTDVVAIGVGGVLVGNLVRRFGLGAFVLEKLLLRENLKQDPVLEVVAVIRQPDTTNYKITQQKWQRIYTYIILTR
jgi:hypothetical protein